MSLTPGGGGGLAKAPVNATTPTTTTLTSGFSRTTLQTVSLTLLSAQIVRITLTADLKYGAAPGGVHPFINVDGSDVGPGASAGNFDWLVTQTAESQLFSVSIDVQLAVGAHTIKFDVLAAAAVNTATFFWNQLSVWFSNT